MHSAEELYYLYSIFPENIKLYLTSCDKKYVAGVVDFIYDNVVHTQYLASNDTGRKIGALDFLVQQLMCIYQNKKYFDFGISSENGGLLLNDGLIAQKEGFGSRTVAYKTYLLDFLLGDKL